MRDIKFRAWSNKWDRMIYPEDSFYDINVHTNTAWKDSCDDECIELMQYTGLHDKNGMEIYEGDIIKGYYDFYSQSNEVKGTVAWRKYSNDEYYQIGYTWGIARRGIDDDCRSIWEIDDIEIIGNIYENQELLE